MQKGIKTNKKEHGAGLSHQMSWRGLGLELGKPEYNIHSYKHTFTKIVKHKQGYEIFATLFYFCYFVLCIHFALISKEF